jgi:hypothetical protein
MKISFFTRAMEQAATIPRQNPEVQLGAIEQARRAYQAAERIWDEAKLAVMRYKVSHPRPDAVWTANDAALVHVNVLKNEDPQLSRLCGVERAAARARNNALRDWLRKQGKLF